MPDTDGAGQTVHFAVQGKVSILPTVIPPLLVDEIQAGRVSLMLGAGASCEAQLPTAHELAELLLGELPDNLRAELEDLSLADISDYLQAEPGYGAHWVRSNVVGHISRLQDGIVGMPSAAHGSLCEIHWRTMFTTNYDRLVEIAYERSPNRVQGLVPFYEPDSQLWVREPDELKLIKLNGSMDEAKRKASHLLVLTYEEQRRARDQRKDFYELLRQESLNGAVVFAGFGFTHPGATAALSAPEVGVLRKLLDELGPAGRWHYAVMPLDRLGPAAKHLSRQLEASRVQVIDATFDDFMVSLRDQLRHAPAGLAQRPPLRVPVAGGLIEIPADAYAQDRRQFELLGSEIEQLEAPSVEDSLNGSDNWASFLQSHVIARECMSDFGTVVANATEAAPDICLLVAPPGWGKTFLLRDLAVRLYRAGQPVIWLNPFATVGVPAPSGGEVNLGKWDAARIDYILSLMSEDTEQHPNTATPVIPVIVADNCPERATEVVSLFHQLRSSNRRFVLLMSLRDAEVPGIRDSHPLLRKAHTFEPHKQHDSRREVRKLVSFCAAHQIGMIEDKTQEDIIAQQIIREEADTSVLLALHIIFDKEHRPFSEIVRDMWTSLQSQIDRDLVLTVASVHRFGSAFAPRLYAVLKTLAQHPQDAVMDAYVRCLKAGIIKEHMLDEEPCVGISHALIAEHLVRIATDDKTQPDKRLLSLVRSMTRHPRDLEIIRRLLKRGTDYELSLCNEQHLEALFAAAAEATSNDWVVCQQYAKYLLQRNDHELAFVWAERALEDNPDHGPLHHTKGNVFRHWGMARMLSGDPVEAASYFRQARECFATSRLGGEPNEYGYVTHLEMLIYLMRQENSEMRRAALQAEGVLLYRDGLRAISPDRFNLLVDDRFRSVFDISGEQTTKMCAKLAPAVADGTAPPHAAAFVADYLCHTGKYEVALKALKAYRQARPEGCLAWVKEAELRAGHGDVLNAAKCIDSARQREQQAEDKEVLGRLRHWDLVLSLVLGRYEHARTAAHRLRDTPLPVRQWMIPQGYVWKESARDVPGDRRSFGEHAVVWEGRIKDLKHGGTGFVDLTDGFGERFAVPFNTRYFRRQDLRRGQAIKFVLTILPGGVRADEVESKPYADTTQDVFVPDSAVP